MSLKVTLTASILMLTVALVILLQATLRGDFRPAPSDSLTEHERQILDIACREAKRAPTNITPIDESIWRAILGIPTTTPLPQITPGILPFCPTPIR
jgi:hypothetical protein